MNFLILFIVATGMALVMFSFVKPTPLTLKTEPSQASPNTICSEIDYMFQRNLTGGMIDKNDKRNQVYDRMAKLAPEIRRLNQEIANLYDDLHSTWNEEKVPSNLKELDYQYGQKLITVPFENRHREGMQIPNFERPTFLDS